MIRANEPLTNKLWLSVVSIWSFHSWGGNRSNAAGYRVEHLLARARGGEVAEQVVTSLGKRAATQLVGHPRLPHSPGSQQGDQPAAGFHGASQLVEHRLATEEPCGRRRDESGCRRCRRFLVASLEPISESMKGQEVLRVLRIGLDLRAQAFDRVVDGPTDDTRTV